MPARKELKAAAKEQIKGRIGTFFLCYLVAGLIGGTIIGALFIPAIMVGLCMMYLTLTKGGTISFGDMFKGANLFGRALWLDIIMQFFILLWSMLLVVPGIIKTFAYSMSVFILADRPELTAREALRESKRITQGHKMKLFVLQLSFIPWFMLCGITFGIAMIYVAPYVNATLANFYNAIKDTPQEAPQGEPA